MGNEEVLAATHTVSFEFPFAVGDMVTMKTTLARFVAEAVNATRQELLLRDQNGARVGVFMVGELMVAKCHGGTQGFAKVIDEHGTLSVVPAHMLIKHRQAVAEACAAFDLARQAATDEILDGKR